MFFNNDYNSSSLLNHNNNRFNDSYQTSNFYPSESRTPNFYPSESRTQSFYPSESRTSNLPQNQRIPDLRNFTPPVDIRNYNFMKPYANVNNDPPKYQNNKNYNTNNKINKNFNRNKNNKRNNYRKQNRYNNRQTSMNDFDDFDNLSKLLKKCAKKFMINFIESNIDEWLDEIEEKAKKYLNLPNKKHSENYYEKMPHGKTINIPKTVTIPQIQKSENDVNTVQPYNIDEYQCGSCPNENFGDKIFNRKMMEKVEKQNFNLKKKETKEEFENKLNQYKKNYLFKNFDVFNKDPSLKNILENLDGSLLETLNTNNENENENKMNNIDEVDNNKENINNSRQNCKEDENNFNKTIYSEIFTNLMNNIDDNKLENIINSINRDLLNNNNSNDTSSDDTTSSDEEYIVSP